MSSWFILLQVFASSLNNRAIALKRQRRKQNKLMYKMLPSTIVEKLRKRKEPNETFDSATIYFCSVVGFSDLLRNCDALEVRKKTGYILISSPIPHFPF